MGPVAAFEERSSPPRRQTHLGLKASSGTSVHLNFIKHSNIFTSTYMAKPMYLILEACSTVLQWVSPALIIRSRLERELVFPDVPQLGIRAPKLSLQKLGVGRTDPHLLHSGL